MGNWWFLIQYKLFLREQKSNAQSDDTEVKTHLYLMKAVKRDNNICNGLPNFREMVYLICSLVCLRVLAPVKAVCDITQGAKIIYLSIVWQWIIFGKCVIITRLHWWLIGKMLDKHASFSWTHQGKWWHMYSWSLSFEVFEVCNGLLHSYHEPCG